MQAGKFAFFVLAIASLFLAAPAQAAPCGNPATTVSSNAAIAIVNSGRYRIINYRNREIGDKIAIAAPESAGACHMQLATVVKSIHAMCESFEGREFSASHMLGDTWIDSGYEGEIARCIPGSHLRILIGDVAQSDQGLEGAYDHAQTADCGMGEALRRSAGGGLGCAPNEAAPDATERTNLRRWGTGDFFFSIPSQVCVIS